ncbi:E3 ubiquitin-protein ligase RBBP6 isoform X3 [Cotesia glomerata]|uniref:E3 ubiquitin-protein ligase RBBP6 isoform X3 n=1 Tax=Cotesia glomerata TaxID=32391 RepID=UPI001D00A328|nr:E3 ubiquitin-protein ligase RBBP6 isoform X3 [Cotesia glomerata]
MSVHYKFKTSLESHIVSFDGLNISVADLKKAIFHQKRFGKNADFDLLITNAETKEDYTDDNILIPKNTSLIVARIPLTVQQKRSWNRSEPQSFVNLKDESNLGHAVDLTRLDGSEEDKIRAMMTQSTQDYDPSNYMKIRGANQSGEVPPKYRCNKCHQPGHWIKNCPLGVNQEPIEIKKSTGIPRSFMVPVEGPSVPGAMMTPTGHYAVPAIDHQAYKEVKKERPPFSNDPEPIVKKPEIPEDLLCNLCKDLLTDAVMIPCCGNSFCDECIRTLLLESEDHQCPDCPEKDISPENLIPSRFLRNAVMNFKNETGYAKQQTYHSIQKNIVPKNTAPVSVVAPPVEEEKVEVSVVSVPVESKEPPQELVPTEPENFLAPQDTYEAPVDPGINDKLIKLDVESESIVHPSIIEEDSEVVPPPPPGTEPLLPIPSVNSSPEKSNDVVADEKKDYNYDYEEDRRPRERRQSFSKDNRERGDNRRPESVRSITKRRSLSPRQSRRNDYPVHNAPVHQSMNPVKGYQNIPSNNSTQYNTNTQHYDTEIRRPDEDPNSGPVMDHQYPPSTAHQAPLLPYPPGEDRMPSLQPPPPQGYSQPPPVMQQHNAPPPMSDPYMGHRMPMYPHQQGPHYGPPRYSRPQYQQQGYRPSQPRNYNGPPRPMRGMHHLGYRGIQPPPPGLGRNIYNGNPPGVIDDPLEAFERMLREKDERDRRLGKGRRRSRSRSRRSYTRSRSRSISRRSPLPPRVSRSRSPPPKRRSTRSPPPLRQRSRTPKRRSRSASVSISRSRSYSRSQSPRSSISRDRERDRERGRERERERERNRDRERDPEFAPSRYRSPDRPRPRFPKDQPSKSRESREKYNSYYNDPPGNEYGFKDRERDIPNNRERSGYRYPPRNQTAHHNIPPLMPHLNTGAHPPQPQRSFGGPSQDRKDYYDSYNRYPGPPNQRLNSPGRKTHHKRIDDVAPPGTEGYYDLPPPGVDRDRSRVSKERDREHTKETETENRDRMPLSDERVRERDDHTREKDDRDRRTFDRNVDQDRSREKDDRNRGTLNRPREERSREIDDRERRDKDKDRDDKYNRDHREDDRQVDKRDYDKERHRDDRDRHRFEDKNRGRDRERKERDYPPEKDSNRDRYERPVIDSKKKFQKSSSPYYPQKSWNETKESSPERSRKKDKDYNDKSDEKKKEKKIKDKKKKKDSEEKEKKKKKKKEKKLTQKELEKSETLKLFDDTDKVATDLNVDQLNLAIKNSDVPNINEFEEKSLMINPEPPEQIEEEEEEEEEEDSLLRQEDTELGVNPPNPNFKPIPELKPEFKNSSIDDHYSDTDDKEIKLTDTDEFSVLPNIEENIDANDNEDEINLLKSPSATEPEETNSEKLLSNKDSSVKKSEFLAPMPELSKWERDESTEKLDDVVTTSSQVSESFGESKSTTEVTRDVLKRAENAIFQKAINAIRPIEIKKISENRKILYQNPEPKVFEPELNRDVNKSLNVTVNIGKNERNVEITESSKKGKIDRSKFKLNESHSPTRLSAKERLGEKIDDEKDKKITLTSVNNDRKVFIDDSKLRSRGKDLSVKNYHSVGSSKNDKERERQIQTPPPLISSKHTNESEETHHHHHHHHHHLLKRKRDQEDSDDKDDKKKHGDKKRKKEHRSRSKSREHKKRKEKKHKKDKFSDRSDRSDKKQKHKESSVKRDKQSLDSEDKSNLTNINLNQEQSPVRKHQQQQPKNPKSISDRKRSVLDEASFEPDYSASDSDSDNEDNNKTSVKKIKTDEQHQQFDLDKEVCVKVTKRRVKSTSSDDNSNTSVSSSTESDSSDDSSYRRRKKKHKKHKKRKLAKKESSSELDSDSDSTQSSSEEEKYKKKSKKSKSKKKQLKKKKKSKHK